MSAGKILIFFLDDSPGEIALARERLEREDFYPHVRFFTEQEKFIHELSEDVNLTVIDYMLDAGVTGIDILNKIALSNDLCKNIVVSGVLDVEMVIECVRAGAHDFVVKDHVNYMDELVGAIHRLLPAVKRLQNIKTKWVDGVIQ